MAKCLLTPALVSWTSAQKAPHAVLVTKACEFAYFGVSLSESQKKNLKQEHWRIWEVSKLMWSFLRDELNGKCRIRIWRYDSTICLAICCGDIRPYIGLIYGRYLQFRFLKWTLMNWWTSPMLPPCSFPTYEHKWLHIIGGTYHHTNVPS